MALPIPANCVAQWRLANDLLDSSGNNHHLTDQGTITYDGTWATFGTGDYGELLSDNSAFSKDYNNAFSLEFFMSTSMTLLVGIMGKYNGKGYLAGDIAGGYVKWQTGNHPALMRWKVTTGTFNDGNPHHILCTNDGSDTLAGFKLFVDATEVAVTTQDNKTLSMITTPNFRLGAAITGGGYNWYTGLLRMARFWSADVSASASDLYNGGAGVDMFAVGGGSDDHIKRYYY